MILTKMLPVVGEIAPPELFNQYAELYQYWIDRNTGTAYLIARHAGGGTCIDSGTPFAMSMRCDVLNSWCDYCGAGIGFCDCGYRLAMIDILKARGEEERATLHEIHLAGNLRRQKPSAESDLEYALIQLAAQESVLLHQEANEARAETPNEVKRWRELIRRTRDTISNLEGQVKTYEAICGVTTDRYVHGRVVRFSIVRKEIL